MRPWWSAAPCTPDAGTGTPGASYGGTAEHWPTGRCGSSAPDRSTDGLAAGYPARAGRQECHDRLDVRGHVTCGGCLTEGAQGRIARLIPRNGKGGDFPDFAAIEHWAAGVAKELGARVHR